MKIVKTAYGKNKITLSKKEWKLLGKKAGWLGDDIQEKIEVFLEGADATGGKFNVVVWDKKDNDHHYVAEVNWSFDSEGVFDEVNIDDIYTKDQWQGQTILNETDLTPSAYNQVANAVVEYVENNSDEMYDSIDWSAYVDDPEDDDY